MRWSRPTQTVLAIGALCGCAESDRGMEGSGSATHAGATAHLGDSSSGRESGTDPTGGGATGSGAPTGIESTDSAASSTDDDATDGIRFDVRSPDIPLSADGCDKVDFLFAIDNSSSMADEQARLIAAFPGFIAQIRAEVQGQDHHIMVVDSDEHGAWLCEDNLGAGPCQGGAVPNGLCDDYTCGTFPSEPCASELGAGVTAPYGGSASNRDCGFASGRRYLRGDDANLDTQFACAAQVGATGHSYERPMTAAVTALSDPQRAPGACNEGFLRDDALLVLTVITDDPSSPFDPDDAGEDAATGMQWYDAVVAAKGGDPSRVVTLGLVPYEDFSCTYAQTEVPSFMAFLNAFGTAGRVASVCEADYVPFFADAVGLIDEACDAFIPPG